MGDHVPLVERRTRRVAVAPTTIDGRNDNDAIDDANADIVENDDEDDDDEDDDESMTAATLRVVVVVEAPAVETVTAEVTTALTAAIIRGIILIAFAVLAHTHRELSDHYFYYIFIWRRRTSPEVGE
jgi:hypothetical protein